MSQDLPSFQRYQLAFTAHIRDPIKHPRPNGVPAKRMAVYEEVVFNNLFESISACFPVAQQVLGKRIWSKLAHAFLREHSASSPLFRQIPEEFVNFLASANSEIQLQLPPYIASLCHYEWIELLVATMPVPKAETNSVNKAGDLIAQHPVFTPAMQLLHYEYDVHKISRRRKPKQKISTQLLVYRNAVDDVKFIELNAVTYRLISLLQQDSSCTGKQALTLLAAELHHSEPEQLIIFGREILDALKSQGIILGVQI